MKRTLTAASSLSPSLNNEETHHHELSRNNSTSTMFMKLINGKKETIGRKNGELTTITYEAKRVIGAGSFGIVLLGVCHRDVKPGNVLVDPLTHQVKICDFGLAKVLVRGTGANGFCVGTSWLHAPRAHHWCNEIYNIRDIWSAGCVFAQLLLGRPLFPTGDGDEDHQLVEIIKVLVLQLEKKFDA
ncbi:hypothetical protein M0R45_016305 [Rubus argutus]|uniref:Protein kinase domain-containing protein n=1 Tax=Rubus argutus TaxID=59490 RepID=A0AAW1XUP8_RUBAR